ncbi:unnamed protein product, partial [Mesorhabditis belari]|uniref:Uncharacterized protein n=1 Tax=Mesorhabditis belari TaxID=2138241 RepID=A0AAF3ENY5_9BILA
MSSSPSQPGCCENFLQILFAVIFDGNFYWFAERCCVPYCLLVFFAVSIIKGVQINRAPLANTGYICYGGYYFSPLDLINVLEYEGNEVFLQLNVILAITSLVIMGLALISDLLMLWKIRKFGSSDQKRRAYFRLTILLITTNFIWAAYNFLEVDYILQFRFFAFLTDGAPPIIVFIVYETNHVLGNSISSLVTILFTWPPRKEQNGRVLRASTLISTRASLQPL